MEQALAQYLIQSEVKNLYTDIEFKNMNTLTELLKNKKITVKQPNR